MMNLELKNYNSLKEISDWIELFVAVNGEITKAQVDHILINNDFAEDNTESFISSIWNELKGRNERYKGINPMEIDSISIETNISWVNYPEYVMMLILSLEGNNWDIQNTGILFERICKEALEEYIGGQARVVGFPHIVSVEDMCKEIEEKFISELPLRYKDRKLDVVGWSRIDNRNNKLLILMQCAAGNNWKSKTTELQIETWSKYINFGCVPTRAFAFAHCIDDDLFFDIGIEGGIIFDRLRLYKYLNKKKEILDGTLRNDILLWCQKRLNLLVA